MANNFTFYSPTEIVFGRGTHAETARYVQKYHGSKVLVVYGSERVVQSGLLESVVAPMRAVGLGCHLLGGVVPNPHLSLIYEGIKLCKENQVDFILAVGGGSVIDSAKAIGYGLANEGDVWDLFRHVKKAEGCYPIGSILTIAAAGSETSNSCVITKEDEGRKRAYDDDVSRPKFAVMNPALTMTLPAYQTASGCTDIMMHTMERYFTRGETLEITDAISEAVMRTVMANAEILQDDPQNYSAREEVMWTGSLSHNSLTGCGNDGGDFSCHMIEHELGGMFDVTHGAGLAALWPSWARYCLDSIPGRFSRFARNVMGVTSILDDKAAGLEGIRRMEDFYHRIGMPINLKELGIEPTDEQIRELAEETMKAAGGQQGSARVLHAEDVVEILKMAKGF